MTIDGVGCLMMAPPTLQLGQSYPFNRDFLFITFGGMSARESGGRWNVG